MTENGDQTIGLTIYLAKPTVRAPGDVIRPEYRKPHRILGPADSPLGHLYYRSHRKPSPKWAAFFDRYVPPADFGQVSTAGAVLVMKAEDRLFAITFGTGHFSVDDDAIEERFGLRVVLNSIGEETIRRIDKQTLDPVIRNSREETVYAGSTRDFGIDVERDLLRAMKGTPDASIGTSVGGMDSLRVTTKVSIDSLSELLPRLLARFLDQGYKKRFDWADHLGEIRDPGLIESLDDKLIARISLGQTGGIWMAAPGILERDAEVFRYSRHGPEHNDIHLDHFRSSLKKDQAITKDLLTQRRILGFDGSGSDAGEWSAYQCLYAEIDDGTEVYVLSNKKWYRVAADFVAQINKFFDGIPQESGLLPPCSCKEPDYNKTVAKNDARQYLLMDNDHILIEGGPSRIEFCDLFTRSRDIIHVKHYRGSNSLSYLFQQGLLSGELFRVDPEFRKKVVDKIQAKPGSFPIGATGAPPKQDEYRVVFAIISNRPSKLVLPFFARLSLKHAVEHLRGYGYRVALTKVDEMRFTKLPAGRARGANFDKRKKSR